MTVRNEQPDILAATDEYDDFEDLLNASSLGAPHVVAVRDTVPEPMRRHLREAATAARNAPAAPGPDSRASDASCEPRPGLTVVDIGGGTTDIAILDVELLPGRPVALDLGTSASTVTLFEPRDRQSRGDTDAAGDSRRVPRAREAEHRPMRLALWGTLGTGKTTSLAELISRNHRGETDRAVELLDFPGIGSATGLEREGYSAHAVMADYAAPLWPLAVRLRRAREEAGLSIGYVARALDSSTAKISRIEHAVSPVRPADLRMLLELYGAHGARSAGELEQTVRARAGRTWWSEPVDHRMADVGLARGLMRRALDRDDRAVTLLAGSAADVVWQASGSQRPDLAEPGRVMAWLLLGAYGLDRHRRVEAGHGPGGTGVSVLADLLCQDAFLGCTPGNSISWPPGRATRWGNRAQSTGRPALWHPGAGIVSSSGQPGQALWRWVRQWAELFGSLDAAGYLSRRTDTMGEQTDGDGGAGLILVGSPPGSADIVVASCGGATPWTLLGRTGRRRAGETHWEQALMAAWAHLAVTCAWQWQEETGAPAQPGRPTGPGERWTLLNGDRSGGSAAAADALARGGDSLLATGVPVPGSYWWPAAGVPPEVLPVLMGQRREYAATTGGAAAYQEGQPQALVLRRRPAVPRINVHRRHDVHSDLTARLLNRRGHTEGIPVRFTYKAADPYVVCLVFRTPRGDVVWNLARELLAEALDQRTGTGDVVAWSHNDDQVPLEDRSTFLMLRPGGNAALMALPREQLRVFLAQTRAVVGIGAEYELCVVALGDIERELRSAARSADHG
jgi:transcriptional regulator with XRE-family HTH domain